MKVQNVQSIGGNHVSVPAPELQVMNTFWKINLDQSLVVSLILQITTTGVSGTPVANKVYQVFVQVSCLRPLPSGVSYTCSTGSAVIVLPTNMNGNHAILQIPLNPPVEPETTEIDDLSFIVTGTPILSTTPGVIAVTPNATPTLDPSGMGTLQVTLMSINGFAGTVALTPMNLDPGVMVSSQDVTLAAGGSADATLQVDASSAGSGNYLIIVDLGCVNCPSGNFLSSPASWWILRDFCIPGISLSAKPTVVDFIVGGLMIKTVTKTIHSFCGFSGLVTLSASVSPSNGPIPTLPAGPYSLSPGTPTVSVVESIDATGSALGPYTITNTATSGALTATALVTGNVSVLP